MLGPRRVAYLDAHGSGSETIAHLRENGRICVMFCAFEGPPRILRLHGSGEALLAADPRFEELSPRLGSRISIPEARRSIVVVDVERVGDSCGYGVPLMSFEGLREHHALASAKRLRTMGADGYLERQRERGARSLDGLPRSRAAEATLGASRRARAGLEQQAAISSGSSQFGVWPIPRLQVAGAGRPPVRARRGDEPVELAPGDRRRNLDPVEVLAYVAAHLRVGRLVAGRVDPRRDQRAGRGARHPFRQPEARAQHRLAQAPGSGSWRR